MGLFGNGGSAAQKITRYTSLDIQTSALGVCIPLLWGRNRIGCNLIWTGDFQSKPVSGKGGGKGGGGKGSGEYDYYCALIAALCEGVVSDVIQCWQDQQSETLSYWGLGLVTGTQSQSIPSWFTSNFPSQALSYAGTAYVWAEKYSLGESATLPNLTFEVDGNLSGTQSAAGIPDANPADIINDYLTNSLYGLDPGATYIDSTSLAYYHTYCLAQALLLSPYLRTQEQATQTLQRWAQLTNSWIFWNGVEMKFVPLGDQTITNNGVTYTPNLTPIYSLDEDDFIPDSKDGPLVTVTRIDPADGYNRVEIDNRNRNDLYNTDPTYWEDSTSVSTFGQLQSQTITADEVCDPNVATIMAALIGQRSVYIRNTYEFTLDYSYVLLEPGDIVTITDSNIGLSNAPVRITDVSEDDKGYLKFGAEECPGSVGIPSANPKQTVTNNIVNTQVNPGTINPPYIMEPPVSLTGGVPELWIGASGGSNWGGAQIWVSADGTNYASVGELTTPIIQGTLTASLSLHADPDNTNTLSIDLTESDTTLPTSFTSADANSYRTASLIDSEIVSFGTVVSTGAFTYNITGLHRGVYNTTPASHSSGAQFYWINSGDTFTYTLPQAYIGTELYFKFLSFNQFGNALEALSDVTAYTYTPTGVGYTIAPPTSASTAVSRTTQADGTTLLNMTVSWTASTGPNLAGYNVSYSTNGGTSYGTPVQVAAGATSYTLTPAIANTSYIFRVQAYSQNGLALSTYATASSVSSGNLVAAVPSAPSSVTATAVGTQAQVSWASGPQTNLFYTISRASGTGQSFSSASIIGYAAQGSTTYLDTSTSASTGYTYFVQASNAAGTSSASSGVNCTTGTVATSIVVEVNNTVDAVGTISFNTGLLGTINSGTLELSVPTQLTLEAGGTTETASYLNFGSNLTATLASGTLTISGAPQTYFENAGTVVSANTLNISSGLTASVASGTLTLTAGGGSGGAGTLELYQGGSYTPFGTLVATNGVTAAVASNTLTLQGLSYANQGTLVGGTSVAGSTFNPSYVGGSSTLSNGNLTFNGSNSGSSNWTTCIAQATNTTGVTKFYWEITTGTQTGGSSMIGLANYSAGLSAWLGDADANGIGFEGQGSVWYNGNGSYETGITYGANTNIGIAWDSGAGKVWFSIGGSWVSGNPATGTGGSTMPVTGTPRPAVSVNGTGSSMTANFGSSAFSQTIPSGFTAWGAASVSTVNISEMNFATGLNAVLSGSTLTVTNSDTLVLQNGGTVITPGTLNFGGGTTISQSGSIATLSVGGGGSGGAGTLELYQGGSYTPFGTLVATNGVSAAVGSSTLTLQGMSYANQGTLIAQPAVSTFNTAYVGGSSTLSNGNLTFNGSNSGSYNWTNTFSTVAGNTGTLYYFEVTFTAGASYYMIGLADISINLSDCLGRDSNGIGFENNGHLYSNGDKGSGTSPTYTPPCTLGLAWNTSTNQVWVQTASGVWFGGGNPVTNTGGTTYLMSTTAYPAVAIEQSGGSATANFGATAFAYPVPSGYVPWGVPSTLNISELNFTTGLNATLNNGTLTVTNSDTLVLQNTGTVLTAGTLNFAGGTTITTSGGIATLSVGTSGGSSTGTGSLISRPALSTFTWLNQGSAVATDNTNGPLTIQSPTTTGDNLRYLIQSTPVANTSAWTVTAQLRGLRPLTNYVPIGLILYDSSSGKALTMSSQITGSGYGAVPYCYVNVNAWNSVTSYDTAEVSYNMMLTEPFWMRIYCDGTYFNFEVSADGYDFLTIKQLGISTWGSPNHVGFGMDFIDTSSVGLQPEVKLLNWDLRTGTGSSYVPPTYQALAPTQLVNVAAGVPALSTFTAINQSANTTVEYSGKAIFFKTAGSLSSPAISGYSVAAPSTPYRVAVLLQGPIESGSSQIGCGWTDGTKYEWISFQTEIYVQQWNAYNSYHGADHTANIVPALTGSPVWFGLHDDGTYVYFEVSYDGVNFVTVYSVAKSSGYLSNYNTVWWGGNFNAGGETTPLSCTLRVWDVNGLSRSF